MKASFKDGKAGRAWFNEFRRCHPCSVMTLHAAVIIMFMT